MKAPFLAIALVLVGVLSASGAQAQTTQAATSTAAPQTGDPSISPNRALGEVKVKDAAAKQLIIKTDAGSLVTVTLSDATSYMRVASEPASVLMINCLAAASFTFTSPKARFGLIEGSPVCGAAVEVVAGVVCACAPDAERTPTSTSAIARNGAFITPPLTCENLRK